MKKTMLLGMVLLTMVFGVTGCQKTYTDEEIVRASLVEDYGHENFEVEIIDYDEKTDELKYLSYENGNLRWCGTIDKSWAESTFCK